MASITSLNAALILQVDGAGIPPTQIQGFGVDDMFGVEPLTRKEIKMGVDGFLAAGLIRVPVKMHITVMASSVLSVGLFDLWDQSEQIAGDVFAASGSLIMPALSKQWELNTGYLEMYPPIPDARKSLSELKYTITWQSVPLSLI